MCVTFILPRLLHLYHELKFYALKKADLKYRKKNMAIDKSVVRSVYRMFIHKGTYGRTEKLSPYAFQGVFR